MAPVIAIGSSALVAGTAAIAGATAKKVIQPTITISDAAPGAFRFTLNGIPVSFKGSSGRFTAKIGINRVTEISAPAMYRSLSSITVSPKAAEVGSSLKTDTVSVRLLAGKSATVRFSNEKLVVVVPSPTPIAPPSNPGPSSPPPSNPPVSNPAPVTSPTDTTGAIEICKSAADDWVEGSFPYTVTAGTAAPTSVSVAVGSCSAPITEPAGAVTITEGDVGASTGYSLVDVVSSTAGSLGTVDLATGTANVTVTAGQDTGVEFVNATNVNTVKVCKTLLDNMGSLAGSTFDFNVSWTFTPANGAAPISGGGTVGVVAVAAPGSNCALYGSLTDGVAGAPGEIPVTSAVTITEGTNVPDVQVTGVVLYPPSDGTTTATSASIVEPQVGLLGVAGSGLVEATFTNDPMGWVEVCKKFDPWFYDASNSASFSVNGGAAITVDGGACSAPIEVPAGTATVAELGTSDSNFYLENITTVSASDPIGARLLTSGGPSLADPNVLPVNPATVTVPYGNVSNETVVTFINTVDPTQFKICKQEDSYNANLAGDSFKFEWSYEPGTLGTYDANEVDSNDSVSLTIGAVPAGQETPGGLVCSGLIWGPPAINANGSTNEISVTEESTTLEGVQADGYTLQGNGWTDEGTSEFPAEVSDGGSATVVFTPAAGENVLTFTNGRTPAPPA
jgi:hypothetical protein